MRFGLSPTQSERRFDTMLRQAELAEALGYDVLWAHEHHAGAMMYPSPLMTLAALVPATRRIGLGTNMLLLPLYHPLRVAEDGAMVDVMSGGRLLNGRREQREIDQARRAGLQVHMLACPDRADQGQPVAHALCPLGFRHGECAKIRR